MVVSAKLHSYSYISINICRGRRVSHESPVFGFHARGLACHKGRTSQRVIQIVQQVITHVC